MYNITLWLLPIERWKRRKTGWMGALIVVPFSIALYEFAGTEPNWTLIPSYVMWKIFNVNPLPEEKGIDWILVLL